MARNLLRFVILSAVNHQITLIVTESLLFKPLRRFVKMRSHYLGELVSCHLCFGTWVGFFLALVYRPRLLDVPGSGVGSVRRRGVVSHAIAFITDSFAIALGGRAINEMLGLLKREVAKTEEEKELLEVERERKVREVAGEPSAAAQRPRLHAV